MSTVAMSVTNHNMRADALLADTTTLTNHGGYLELDVTSIDYDIQDQPKADDVSPEQAYQVLPYSYRNDFPAFLALSNYPTPNGRGGYYPLLQSWASKSDGVKPVTCNRFLIAVNKGKCDGNACQPNLSTTRTEVAKAALAKNPSLCDDLVTVTLTYTIGWTQLGSV